MAQQGTRKCNTLVMISLGGWTPRDGDQGLAHPLYAGATALSPKGARSPLSKDFWTRDSPLAFSVTVKVLVRLERYDQPSFKKWCWCIGTPQQTDDYPRLDPRTLIPSARLRAMASVLRKRRPMIRVRCSLFLYCTRRQDCVHDASELSSNCRGNMDIQPHSVQLGGCTHA